MPSERVYYHLTFTVTRARPVFLNAEIDATFKQLVAEIAQRKGWRLVELETMPTHVHLLLEKAPWQDLSELVGYLKGVTARRLLQQFDWLHPAHKWWQPIATRLKGTGIVEVALGGAGARPLISL